MAFALVFPCIEAVNYRLYHPDDFAQLYSIEEASFQPPLRFSRRYMRHLILSPSSATWIAEEEEVMAGFAIVEWSSNGDNMTAYIQTLEVLPGKRRQGIGSDLLTRMEASAMDAGAGQIWLHVDESNDSAVRLYRSHGYELRGREADFYAPTLAAEIYCKKLQL